MNSQQLLTEARRIAARSCGRCQVKDASGIHRCNAPVVAATTLDWCVGVCERHAALCEANGFMPVRIEKPKG